MIKIINDHKMNRSCIVAESRKNRPFVAGEKSKCPFCIGNEHMLEVIHLEHKRGDHFDVRIVNNKYPVCGEGEALYGVHDVVIDTCHHQETLKDFTMEHFEILFTLMKQRWQTLSENKRIGFIQIFKNAGLKAGASIAHSHWQIVALENIPLSMKVQYDMSRELCILCDDMEKLDYDHIVLDHKEWLVVAPTAPQMNYETWIVPKRHISNYEELDEKMIQELSEVFYKLARGYERFQREIQYNICIMSAPPKMQSHYHFYIKFIPREGNFAGFEFATGCNIIMIDPKNYAKELYHLINQI